ncbi:hypothetical protein [Winogradskyella ursingii]|uniref:hypothetical protein n=1 Tax=Winogradskyella ursingii TaxID=2686079 RepID=UPI0015CE1EE9|nr:hypothetical protein [Winogradskyella ursingii]
MIKFFRQIRHSLITESRFGKYLLYAIGEIILVFIGIFMALQFNNWNEEKKIKKNIATTLNLLKDEIKTNKKSILSVKDYHIMIKDTLPKIDMSKNEKDIKKALGFWSGMRTPRLRDAAFQTSIQSGVSKEFNPVLLNSLNNLYTYQESYNEFTSQSTQIFFNTDLTDPKSFGKILASVQIMMNDLFYYERELTESYDFCLKQIDSLYKIAL